MKKLIIIRRISQSFFILMFLYVLWSTTYPLTGKLSPELLFKIDPLLMLLTAISQRIFIFGIIFSAVMIILSLIFGRFFCGWICPFGSVLDLFANFNRKNKIRLNENQNKIARKPKFIILAIIFTFAIIGIQIAWIFDPIVIFARVVSLNIIPFVTLMVNKFFISIIQSFDLYDSVYDFYRVLKNSFLGVNIHFFANSLITFLFFISVSVIAFFVSRSWCRSVCPLGAFYSLVSRFAMFSRIVSKCTKCSVCKKHCRMGAINEDISYQKGECILCMDCVYDCPVKSTSFEFKNKVEEKKDDLKLERKDNSISRKNFLFLFFTSILTSFSFGFGKTVSIITFGIIRPPGALAEKEFVNVCVRCGNCMKVCPTNGLQPIMMDLGFEGLWTPQLVPEIGYCEYNCNLCGNVCPTGAITKIDVNKKKATKIGLAVIDKSICIPWSQNKNCIVCEEHCPVSDKAIKAIEDSSSGIKLLKPCVDKDLCIGCGICQNKCPVSPQKAIKVNPSSAKRFSLRSRGQIL